MRRSSWFTPDRRRVLRQSLKGALAATVATGIAMALSLPVPWFATIAAIVTMEVTLRSSLRTARNSLVGAVVGAGVGLALASIAKDQLWAVGVAVLVLFSVFGLAKFGQVGRQAALVATVIVLIPVSTDLGIVEFAGVRLAETVIGIIVALAVNAVVLPPRAHRGARRHLGLAFLHLQRMYSLVSQTEHTGRRDTTAIVAARRGFRSEIREVDELWDDALAERPSLQSLSPHWRAMTRRIWEQCAAMDDASTDVSRSPAMAVLRAPMSAMSVATVEALGAVGHAMVAGIPLPDVSSLEERREELLDALQHLGVEVASDHFSQVLHTVTYLNAMAVVAARHCDLRIDDEVAPEDVS